MPRVDFYIVSTSEREALWHVACRITEKAWRRGDRVYVHAPSQHEAARVDEALWTFRQESFVPHTLHPGPGGPGADGGRSPVLVGHGEPPADPVEVLVNLCETVPGFFEHFPRIAEIVGADPQARERARARYRYYREQGCVLNSHHL